MPGWSCRGRALWQRVPRPYRLALYAIWVLAFVILWQIDLPPLQPGQTPRYQLQLGLSVLLGIISCAGLAWLYPRPPWRHPIARHLLPWSVVLGVASLAWICAGQYRRHLCEMARRRARCIARGDLRHQGVSTANFLAVRGPSAHPCRPGVRRCSGADGHAADPGIAFADQNGILLGWNVGPGSGHRLLHVRAQRSGMSCAAVPLSMTSAASSRPQLTRKPESPALANRPDTPPPGAIFTPCTLLAARSSMALAAITHRAWRVSQKSTRVGSFGNGRAGLATSPAGGSWSGSSHV